MRNTIITTIKEYFDETELIKALKAAVIERIDYEALAAAILRNYSDDEFNELVLDIGIGVFRNY